jgi:hypothetical protein
MSVSDVNTAMTAAQSALDSADYATALDSAIAAQGYLAALPDSEDSVRSMAWDSKKIQGFIDNVRTRRDEALATSGGIQRTKIVHGRTSVST